MMRMMDYYSVATRLGIVQVEERKVYYSHILDVKCNENDDDDDDILGVVAAAVAAGVAGVVSRNSRIGYPSTHYHRHYPILHQLLPFRPNRMEYFHSDSGYEY